MLTTCSVSTRFRSSTSSVMSGKGYVLRKGWLSAEYSSYPCRWTSMIVTSCRCRCGEASTILDEHQGQARYGSFVFPCMMVCIAEWHTEWTRASCQVRCRDGLVVPQVSSFICQPLSSLPMLLYHTPLQTEHRLQYVRPPRWQTARTAVQMSRRLLMPNMSLTISNLMLMLNMDL